MERNVRVLGRPNTGASYLLRWYGMASASSVRDEASRKRIRADHQQASLRCNLSDQNQEQETLDVYAFLGKALIPKLTWRSLSVWPTVLYP